MILHVKRVYDPPSPADGFRILVDRLWPRGVSKQDAAVDLWAQELAPSHELRKWFGHDERKFDEFARLYQAELSVHTANAKELLASARGPTVTLVYSARSLRFNNAVVVQAWLQKLADGV